MFSKKVIERFLIPGLIPLLGLAPAPVQPPDPGFTPASVRGIQADRLPLETGLLPTGRWSYRVLTGGSATGELTSTVRRSEETITSESDLTGTFIQRGRVVMTASSLRPVRSSTFIYETGEGSTTARLQYEPTADSLRVTGEVAWARLSGARAPLEIDRLLAPAVFDNQALDLIIGALPLERNRAWRLELFEPTTFHETIGVTIDVRGSETVTTPAGRFSTWRVEVRGFTDRVTYWIDDATRIVVAQEVTGRDLRLELITPPAL